MQTKIFKRTSISLIFIALFIFEIASPMLIITNSENIKENTDSKNSSFSTIKNSEINTPDSNGFIRDWLLIGPFTEDETWEEFPTIAGNHINCSLNYTSGDLAQPEDDPISGSDNSKVWFEYESDSSSILLDTVFSSSDISAGYALTYVYFPYSIPDTYIFAGSDDGIRVFVDNNEVHYNHVLRALSNDADKIELGSITAGWHAFMLLIENNYGGFSFSFRFSSSESSYSEIAGLAISLDWQTEWDANAKSRFIFKYDHEIYSAITSSFNSIGGEICAGPWKNINAFAGMINPFDIPNFIAMFPDTQVYSDSIVEAQMNTVQNQLNTYPTVINQTGYGYLGNTNASIAFIDSGLDDSHILINDTYEDLNFSKSVIGWQDFVLESSLPYDDNGHGTSLAAITLGGGNKSLSTNYSSEGYYMTIGGVYSHLDLFYPNHISPGTYSHKIASFNVSAIESQIKIQGTLTETSIPSEFESYEVVLYRNGNFVNASALSTSNISIQWNTSASESGLFEVFMRYTIKLAANPEFKLKLNVTFKPTSDLGSFTNFTGIAPETKVVALKVLNNSGLGYASDVISALEWIWENNSKYHIIASVLSVGNFDMDDGLASIISNLIDLVIENGTMIIIAAGNQGTTQNSFNKLAQNSKAIIVGAINDDDQLTYYSSKGKSLGSNSIKPDIVAPGGSLKAEHSTVITADANKIEPDQSTNEEILDDLTSMTGTSVAAAIVAGVYNLIVEQLGNFSNYNYTEEMVLYIKSLLLMTASETNLIREDNPYTPYYNESLDSPELNRGGTDIQEGYGRINPVAILDLLNNSIMIDQEISENLTASNVNSWGNHIEANTITLEQNTINFFNLTKTGTSLDADLYLYSTHCDEFGNPILLASSTNTGNQNESFYFTNVNETQDFYLIAKAISGSGTIYLNVSNPENSQAPFLQNNSVTSITSNYADKLDIFNFRINYSHPENFGPSFIYLRIDDNLYENITMIKENPSDVNYVDGCWYYANYDFEFEGNYQYHYVVLTGHDYFNYTYDINQEFNLTVNPIYNLVEFGYESTFGNIDELSVWDYDTTPLNMTFLGDNVEVYSGWDWIRLLDIQDNRRSELGNWGAIYCGITGEIVLPNQPLFDENGSPVYTYTGLSGTYNLIGPNIYLNSTEQTDPIVKLGTRISINNLDSIQIQINANRTGWQTLNIFSNIEEEWNVYEYDLSDYMNNYIQIRIQASFDSIPDLKFNKGFMLDLISFEEANQTNNYSPSLSQPENIIPTLVFPFYNPETQPFYISQKNTIFDMYAFQVAYTDQDNDLPEYVNLEIDGKNYTMNNIYGRWNAESDLLSNLLYGYKGIIYSCNISLYNINNSSFRFHTFDGKYYSTTNWQDAIEFVQPPIDYSFQLSGSLLNPAFNTELRREEINIIGEPLPISPTLWIDEGNTWHQVKQLGELASPGEWYCGQYEYSGYGYNWNSSLITPLIYLNGTNELFFSFSYSLILDFGPAGGDFAEVLISTDYGSTWKELITFSESTNLIGTFENIILDISEYINQEAIFQFRFVSDDQGIEQTINTGLKISNLKIDINQTKDYIRPQIEFLNLQDGQNIEGQIELQINITDNRELDLSELKFYINGDLINETMIDNIIYYYIDSTEYENGDPIEFVIIVRDLEGNRALEKIIVYVQNPMEPWKVGMIIGAISVISLIAIFVVGKHFRVKKLMAKGDYVPKPSWLDRRAQMKFEHKMNSDEVDAIISKYDKDWEVEQPYKLHCRSCKTWFKSQDFEIYCPVCKHDSLYIAKHCPICDKWNYFDDEGVHKCKKCDILLLKDFDLAKEQILEQEAKEPIKILDEEEKLRITEKQEIIMQAAQEIPREMLMDLLKKIISDKENDLEDEI